MSKKSFTFVSLIFLTATMLITGCQTSFVPETWTLLKILSTGERNDRTIEEVIVRNCGIPEPKSTNCSAGTTNDLSITGGVTIGAGFAIDASITSGLGIGRESGESMELETPPDGTVYTYTIAKEYHLISGTMLAQSSTGREQNVDYNFHANCSIQIIDRIPTSCSMDNQQSTPFPVFEETTPDTPGVIIENSLMLPVSIFINNQYQGELASLSTGSFLLPEIPGTIYFEAVRETDPNGNPWGEPIAGTFDQVDDGNYLLINSIVGDDFYFYPIFDNYTNQTCEISINTGGGNEVRPGYINSGQQGVQAGYYKMFSNSSVTLFCDDTVLSWGGDNASEPLYSFMQENTGVINFATGP